MSNMGFKILAKFCQEKDVTDAHKEGILLGMHIMGLQSEKWFDNEKHATAFRMDTWDECGFSGWREIYQHTKGFLEAEQPEESEKEMKERLEKNYEKVYAEKYEQPEESEQEMKERLQKNYEKVYSEKYEQPEESEQEMKERLEKNYEKVYAEKMAEKQQKMMDYKCNLEYKRNLEAVAPEVAALQESLERLIAQKEQAAAVEKVNGDDEEMTWEQPEESDVSDMEVTDDDEDEFEVVDNEDEESDWTQYTFENVEYLVGPEADLGRVVLETEDYQPVGVFEDDKIVFEDNLQVANHFQRVRESTIPEDHEEALDLITSFLEDHYGDLSFNDYQESTCGIPECLDVFKDSEDLSHKVSNLWLYFGDGQCHAEREAFVLGKNMGEVMKEIESLL